jgi:ParB family chromosome partitioning protein
MSIAVEPQSIPLNQLVHARANVRRTGRDRGIEALMASIAAHGLRQNLNVRATTGNRFEVVAGGRRLEALKRLMKQGDLPRDTPIPCVVLASNDNPTEISLAENAIRQDMHPDDQCTAFAALIEQGLSIEDVGARFGVTPKVVQQRLKLASVSPKLRKLYRQDRIDTAQMMALALVDDHAAQEAAWTDLPEWNRGAEAIRRALTAESFDADHRMVQFVGLDAYEQAGGAVLRDLFDDEQPAVLTDGALVERLATEALEQAASIVRAEGWSWVSIALKPDYSTPYGRVYPDRQEDGTEAYDPADLARAGARIILDHDGELRVERGLVDPVTVRAERRKQQAGERPAAGLPETLVADLTAHRTAALRLELARRPDLALAATVHALALRLIYSAYDVTSCLELDGDSSNLETRVSDVFECSAHAGLAALMQSWIGRLPDDPKALWDWCLAQGQSVLLDLLALLAGLSVDAVTRTTPDHGRGIAHADALASVLALDMHAHWTPAAEGFFSRLSKAQMATFLKEQGEFDQAALTAKVKKPEAAQRTAKVLLAKGWLPQPLLAAPPVEEPVDGDDDADPSDLSEVADGKDDAPDDEALDVE